MSAIVTQHPRLVELVERRKLRKKVERVVSALIAVLDDLDADPEAEPWLGAGVVLYPVQDDQRLWALGANDDREQVDEDGGDILDGGDDDRVDGEPSLGASENVDQTRWAHRSRREFEGGCT
jgi:hypothetical protein